MNELFLKIVNMSMSAGWLVLAVLVFRLMLSKAPKWTNLVLWGIVAVRLLCPFSLESALSLIPSAQIIDEKVISGPSFDVQTGIAPVDNRINEYLGDRYFDSVSVPTDSGSHAVTVLCVVWIVGMAALIAYAVISSLRLGRKIDTAVRLRDNIFCSEQVDSPFVFGIVRPKIYLPLGMSERDAEHVISHERAHILRGDHLIKLLGFVLLSVHWFNPLMWTAYVLLCRDIELACDERVIKGLDSEQRADYTQALVNCSAKRRTIAACPLAFGEVGVKQRVKSVMNYKKPAFWLVAAALVVCVVASVCFLTNPQKSSFTIPIVVPAGASEFSYSSQEFCADGRYIEIWSGEGLGDTMVVLTPADEDSDSQYSPSYLTHGVCARFEAKRGEWFKVGVSVQNTSNEDITVYVKVENVQARISDGGARSEVVFQAHVLEIHDAYLLVEPRYDSAVGSADQIQVPFDSLGALVKPQAWDIVEITFGGEMAETYPAQIMEVYGVKIIDKADVADADILDIFKSSVDGGEDMDVTDYVYADDKAYGLDGVVQYTDDTGTPWKLAFIRNGIAHTVSQDWQEGCVVSGKLEYLGDGAVRVYIRDNNEQALYSSVMKLSYDHEKHNIKFTADNEVVTDDTAHSQAD